jgi:transcriptional regulator with XRE-family HTH domain
MNSYHYTDSGLDNVVIEGIAMLIDDAGETVVTIPNINGLHKAIALGIIEKRSSVGGKELRYLRTEMGMTQAQLAAVLHREPLTVSRWERGECAVEPNAEAVIRLMAAELLELDLGAKVTQIAGWCVPSANTQPLIIDGTDPTNYQPRLAA